MKHTLSIPDCGHILRLPISPNVYRFKLRLQNNLVENLIYIYYGHLDIRLLEVTKKQSCQTSHDKHTPVNNPI